MNVSELEDDVYKSWERVFGKSVFSCESLRLAEVVEEEEIPEEEEFILGERTFLRDIFDTLLEKRRHYLSLHNSHPGLFTIGVSNHLLIFFFLHKSSNF
jgi:hypothetical protein